MKCCVRGMSAVCQATNMCTDHTDNEWNMLWHLRQSKLLSEVLISGTGVSCGTTVTNPIDVIKTRMQLHPGTNAGVDKPGLVATGVAVVREDGLLGLWKGWSPAVLRAMVYGGLRLGLYNPIKATLQNLDSSCTGMGQHSSHVNTNYEASSSSSRPETSSSSSSSTSSSSSGAGAKATDVSRKLMAGVISGSSAAALLSPTELVKVRLQASNCQQTSATQVVAAVVKDQGLKGLWKGATPGVVSMSAMQQDVAAGIFLGQIQFRLSAAVQSVSTTDTDCFLGSAAIVWVLLVASDLTLSANCS
eukprot:GHRR01017512.1.p1 GENE.GHRR01017512.1~~GHRR01017512.1.p1  ORF type:complete len:303 (+),score=96.72 GHRR01017512.1:227-1135(+)